MGPSQNTPILQLSAAEILFLKQRNYKCSLY